MALFHADGMLGDVLERALLVNQGGTLLSQGLMS